MTLRGWRILGLGCLAAATLLLVAGTAYGLSAVNGSGYGSAATGNLRLGLDAAASQMCAYSALSPGDLDGSATCSMTVIYRGSTPAHVSVTVAIRSSAAGGGRPLYDGTNASGLTFSISDGRHPFTVPTGPGTACATGFTCWTAEHDLAASYDPGDPLVFVDGDRVTLIVTPSFPASADSSYQGGAATLVLTADAVQALANPLPAGCSTATIGRPCPAGGSFTWS